MSLEDISNTTLIHTHLSQHVNFCLASFEEKDAIYTKGYLPHHHDKYPPISTGTVKIMASSEVAEIRQTPNCSSFPRPSPCHFFKLPLEIRLMIYRHSLRNERAIRRRYHSHNPLDRGVAALLKLKHQLSTEASPIFYATKRFKLIACPPPPAYQDSQLGCRSVDIPIRYMPYLRTICLSRQMPDQKETVRRLQRQGHQSRGQRVRTNFGVAREQAFHQARFCLAAFLERR
ncbi:hypothetical protein MMC24_002827 [Lignoscripta atroalba]|nr:hypothetical protein [Lignoscripta atroalba]